MLTQVEVTWILVGLLPAGKRSTPIEAACGGGGLYVSEAGGALRRSPGPGNGGQEGETGIEYCG